MVVKFLKKKFNSIKICAVFTATCFMVSTLGANLYAIPTTDNAKQKYEDVFNRTSSISNEYGKITSSKDANSDITVINIQDLHCHPQTQRNIAKIIGQIADKYNLKKIYVEGGYDDIDVSWLGSIKDENIKNKIIEELVEEGILTGSEYYKLTSKNEKVKLKGIDERKLHKDNINRLSWIIENQDKYKELGKKINQEINFLEQRYVNVRNKRFNSSIEDYLSGKIDTRRFYRQLLKYVKDINSNPDEYNNITAIRLEDYPNISKFMTLRKVSKNINVRDVSYQLQAVINELKSSIPYNVYTQLLKETDNFSDSQKVVELITLLCEKEGIDLDNKYRALSEFLKSNGINRELNTVELVYEERQLITEIRKALSYNNEEYEITFVSDFSRYFQDYLEYKLTDADWKYFESGYEQFRQLYGKYATVDRIKEIESDIAELNKYYEINDIRNEVFVNNLLQGEQPTVLKQAKLRQDEEILKQSKEVIIAVTGGFHSQALEDILQAKEVNTIVITPSIFEGIEKATKQYKGIIKEQSKEFQHQALAYTLASCSDSVVYKKIKSGEQVPSDYAIVREEEDGSVVVAEHFQKRILLNAVVRILGTKDVAKIREVLEPIMGKEALKNLEADINSLEDIGEKFDAKYEPFKNAIDAAVDSIVDSIQTTGKIVFPDKTTIDRAMTGLVTSLISVGQIYFSDGVIFEIENSEFYGKDLAGVPAELYSRMMPTFQRALLLFQTSRTSTVPLNMSSLESDDKIIIVQSRQASDGKTENYDEELSLTIEDLLYIGLNDDNDWTFLTPKSVADRAENLRERKRQTGLLSKAEKKLKDNQVPNYTGDVVDLRIKLKKAQLNKQVVYLSDIFGKQVLIKRKDSKGNDVYCEAVIKYNEETRQWELVPFEEINARYKSIENGLLSKIEDFTKQFEGKTPEEILKEHPVILQLIVLAVIRGYSIDGDFLDNKTITLGGVKGYFAEYLVKYFTETYLSDQYRLAMPIDSNQEGFDLIDKDGYRIQIKAASKRINNADPDKRDIVGHALHKFKGIPVFATSEIAGEYKADTDMVFSYGLSHDLIESIAKVAFDILDNLTPQEKEDLKTKAIGKVVETRYLSEFLKDKDLERRAQQERVNDEQEEVSIRGNRNQQQKAAIKAVDDYVYQGFIDLLKSKLGIADEQVTKQPELDVEEEIQEAQTTAPKTSKLSIFDVFKNKNKIFTILDATAPIWEEIPYRLLPTLIIIGLQYVLMLSLTPASWIIIVPFSLYAFHAFQKHFVRSHIVTDWLNTKDSPSQITTWKELVSFLYKRFKIYAFNIFPNEALSKEFENFYRTDDKAISHRKGLLVPTIAISLPYLILLSSMVIFSAMPSLQLILMTTVAASIIHLLNNILITRGVKIPVLTERKKTADFRHIRGRLEYVRLILEYPEIRNTLPEISEGPRVEKYGMEDIRGRRFLYTQQFININKTLSEKVENKVTTIKDNIQKLEQKKRKSAKDKEDLENLRKELKKYLKIQNELAENTEEKLSKTVDSINEFLSIFEEIDSIIDLIEEYKKNFEGTREIEAIEREFFSFISDVFAEKLMAIYDGKVTGDHVRRVLYLSGALGEYMEMDGDLKFKYKLMLSALFHDIGKNLIPDSILNSQGGFDELEKDIMDFHSVFGYIILKSSILQRLAYCAGEHHNAKKSRRGYGYETKIRQIGETPFGFEHDEEESKIVEIVSLADVYEAVSPKLSIDSERNYQLSRKVQSIKSILEEAERYWGDVERKIIINLIDEINTIEAESNEATRQESERNFVRRVLYEYTTDPVLRYIREKDNDAIRNRAFEIIFTRSPKFIFDTFGEKEKDFMDEFLGNTEIVKDICLDLADKSKLEFDIDVVKAFLDLYFTKEDIEINNKIIDEMGYQKRESRISVFMKRVYLRLDKIRQERQAKRKAKLSGYKPVKVSIFDGFTESGAQTDFDKYFKGKKVLLQRFKTEEGVRRVKGFEILNFDKNSIKKIVGRFEVPVSERNYDSLGIIVEKDSDGNIVSVKAKEGYEFSSLLIDGEPVGDEKNNLNFSLGQISAMLKDVKILDYDAPDIKEDEMDKYVAHIYLDDSKEDLEKAMEEAIKNNKLMVIHVFRKGFSTKSLTLGQIRDKYEQAYSLLQSDKLKNLPILSDMIQLEREVEIDSYITFDFFLKELLKNHFGHGNLGLFEYPIACYISPDGSKMVTYDSSLDLGVGEYRTPFFSEELKNKGITRGVLEELMNVTLIHGDGKGRKMMAGSKTRNFEDTRNVNDSEIGGYRFFKATVTLKTEEQIEAAKQYKKEQDAKARASMSSVTSAGTEDVYSFGSSVSKATEEDWADFWGVDTTELDNRDLTESKTDNVQEEQRVLAEIDLENINKYYKEGSDTLKQSFVVNVGDNTCIITFTIGFNSDMYFELDSMNGEKASGLDVYNKVKDFLGIDIKVSEDKKTLYFVKASNFNENTKIYPLDKQFGISFKDTYEPVSFEFGKNINFSDSEINAVKKDTGATETTDIYLDDYLGAPSELQAKIKNASDNNELIVIHFFRNNTSKTSFTYEQILNKYKQVLELIDLFSFYGSDSDFLITEILKNAFVHGNQCKFEEPVAFYIKVNADGSKINKLAVYNKKAEQQENIQLKNLAIAAALTGQHMGVKDMKENENYDFISGEISLDKNNFYKASAEFHISEEELLTHQEQEKSSAFKTKGAIELENVIEYLLNKIRWLNNVASRLVKSIVRQASIVKHIAIDYKFIKASGIKDAIKMFGEKARLNENGQIDIAIVEDIEQLQDSFTLINTGLKVNGASIYRIANSDLLMYGAKGQQSIKIVQAINGTEQLKNAVMEMMRASGEQVDDVETQGIVTKQGEGIEVKEGIIEIGEMELEGKTIQQVREFITSSLEINRATGIMYGQKTIVGLEYIGASDVKKLESVIENGRARKVITIEQYRQLKLDKQDSLKEYLVELRKNGIEIYIDTSNGIIDEKEIEEGIAGQIVTEEGELYIRDYCSLEQTKLFKVDNEMLKERSLEQIILSEPETIFVGIEVLIEQFRQTNINVVQREFGALIGKIKLSLNIGELNFRDVQNILNNIDYNKIPNLDLSKKIQEYSKEEMNAMLDSAISNIEDTSEIAIILKAIRKNKNFKETDYDAFVRVIKERILAKTALIQGYKEYGLKDKKLEILLGEMLYKQLDVKNKESLDLTYINKDGKIVEVTGEKEGLMRKIMQDTEKAMREDSVAINSIIEIILVYGDEFKEKQLAKQLDVNDARNYRAMMSAA